MNNNSASQEKTLSLAGGLANLRREVISGNWTSINNGDCTLTDLGLRHNGGGLVWLRSGVSVHDADSDTGVNGKAKSSHGYHSALCPQEPAPSKGLSFVVPASKSERFAFTHVAIDGGYLWVYDDHIRFLTKKRHRVDGVRVQGYTAKAVSLEVLP